MYISPLNRLSPLGGNTDATDSVFNLPSALHEWNYQNSTDVGTTVTAIDSGSIGGLNLINPTASQKPTLDANGWTFDGVDDILKMFSPNFRGGDSTGVVHVYVNSGYSGGTSNEYYFVTGDNATNNDDIRFFLFPTNSLAARARLSAVNNEVLTSSTYTTWNVFSLVQDGTKASLFYNGTKITTLTTDAMGNKWFNAYSTLDNISIGGISRLTDLFGKSQQKYAAYCPYVNDATVTNEANAILNGGL